jgi:hypothetical protein
VIDIPLERIITHNSYLSSLDSVGHLQLMQLIKTHFPDIEIRLQLAEPSSSRANDQGGFEVRCLKWREALTRQWDEAYWEERTIYIV